MARLNLFRKPAPVPESADGQSVFAALSPFRIEPSFVTRTWGYCDLRPWYDHAIEKDEAVGEVRLTGDDCLIVSGSHAGATLGQIFCEAPEGLLGKSAPSTDSPLLVKVILAREKLSVQVHPDDWMAKKYGEPHGKTECWYALAAEPGAQVAAGLKPGVTLDDVRDGIADGTLENSLQVLPISAGDMVFVDAGTVHAIWPGSILLVTQQNSDIAYRMFDYGSSRELHVERSLEATRLATRAGKVQPRKLEDRTILVDEDYFCVERIPVPVSRASSSLPGPGESAGLSYLFAAAGTGRITSPSFAQVDLPERAIVCVPASSPMFAIQDVGGLDLIRISPRWPER